MVNVATPGALQSSFAFIRHFVETRLNVVLYQVPISALLGLFIDGVGEPFKRSSRIGSFTPKVSDDLPLD